MTGTTRQPPGGYPRWRALSLVGVLIAVLVSWAALPGRAGGLPRIALICAIVSGLASLAQLALAGVPTADDPVSSTLARIIARLLAGIRAVPWPEALTTAALVLEVQHPARPWHTGLLGIALLGYLFAVHLIETRARAAVLWPQLPLLAAGAALVALAVGAAAVPALPPGPASDVVRVVASVAAVMAGVLVVPVWLGKREP